MKNTIRILAVDGIRELLRCAGNQYELEVEFFSEDEGRLIEKIAFMQPDAVVMNMFMPETDAVEVMKAYRLLYAGSVTYFAVICPFLTSTLKKDLDQCGVNRVICYPIGKRELLSMLSEVARFKTTPLATLKSSGINTVHMLHHRHGAHSSEGLGSSENEIDEVIKALGLNQSKAGSAYLKRAVEIAVKYGETHCSVTKVIYPALAAEFGTSPSCVERRIRAVISAAWRSERSAVISSYFGYTVDNMRGRPTNGELIAMLADRIRLDMAKEGDADMSPVD
ncbi:MAG: hypothetical protein IIY89_03830 [Clostridia bacterium]|nr:hypothetical protein [Clostridia bacterium]